MEKKNEPGPSLSNKSTFTGQPEIHDYVSRSEGDKSTFRGKDAGTPLADDRMEIVDLSSRYKIERALGKGGMGEVFLATDMRLDRRVSIKRILSDTTRSSTAVIRFLTEAKSIAALNHPNIVQIYDYGRSVDGPFLIMEYVDGGNLLDRCRDGAMPADEAIHLTCQLCDGLERAHERGIIHRDIKPANILLTADGIPKLTDFGLAKVELGDSEITMAGAILGTLDFMPPEQRRDATLTDARSDVWSLAATLYQMVTGESPRVIDLDSVPTELRTPLARALKTKKEDRFQTTREFKKALKDCLDNTKPLAPEKPLDLGAGECPSCHTLNEPHRKFCRECGDPLRCSCLKCEYEIPVWDKVCPECGGKQPELIAAHLREIEEQCRLAEDLRDKHRYEEALGITNRVLSNGDRRLSQHRSWALEIQTSTKSAWDQQLALFNIHLQEAEKQNLVFNYQKAITALELIPETLRDTKVNQFLFRLRSDFEKAESILSTIKSHVEERRFAGLSCLLEEAFVLCGDRQDLETFRNDLQSRKDRLDEAEYFRQASDYQAAIQSIESIPERMRDWQIDFLLNQLKAELNQTLIDSISTKQQVKDANPVPALQIPRMTNSIGMSFVGIPWRSRAAEKNGPSRVSDSSNALYLGVYPVTQGDYLLVMGGNPSYFQESRGLIQLLFGEWIQKFRQPKHTKESSAYKSHPVENVSILEATEFCRRLSELPEELESRRTYRLPTEKEWDYACSANISTKYCFGDDESKLSEYAWYEANSEGETHPVGLKIPNQWGLYDMLGNVCEWCVNSEGMPRSPRGGAWNFWASDFIAKSTSSVPGLTTSPPQKASNIGFRIVCSVEGLTL